MNRASMRRLLRDYGGRRRHYPFKVQNDPHYSSYKRFRRQIILHRGLSEGPAASTPLPTGGSHKPEFVFDSVCQRLELESPPRHRHEQETKGPEGICKGTASQGREFHDASVTPYTPCDSGATDRRWCNYENAAEQVWVWRAAAQCHGNTKHTDSDQNRTGDMEPFADLTTDSVKLQGNSLVKLAAPNLINDYYTNVLQCSCNGVIALALGSSVFLWNSETQALLGHLDPNLPGGRLGGHSQSICSLCWSRDGRTLSMGTRRGQIQLWDVEHEKNMSCLPFHLSAVRAISWNQQLLSSGSDLGHIHHHDPRAPTLLAGAAIQQGGVCSLQWSPTDDHLASGSTEGFLHVWDNGITSSHLPIITMKQPSSVKAMGWCPWQRNMIATGGGWTDGQLRIWDVESGASVTSVDTNSQICSLQWVEKNRRLFTGHGLPDHHITCWSWTDPSLRLHYQLTGHSHRVLHLALNPDGSHMFSAGADQVFHMWDVS